MKQFQKLVDAVNNHINLSSYARTVIAYSQLNSDLMTFVLKVDIPNKPEYWLYQSSYDYEVFGDPNSPYSETKVDVIRLDGTLLDLFKHKLCE